MSLFYQDNHFVDKTENYVAQNEQDKLLRTLLKNFYPDYDFSKQEIEVIGGVNLNSMNYRLGSYYFKTLTESQATDRLFSFPKIINCLKEKKLPTPEFILNKDSRPISKFTFDDGTSIFFFLQPFVDGHFFTGTKEEFAEALLMLEKVEDAFETVELQKGHLLPYGSFDPKSYIKFVRDALKNKNGDLDAFDKELLPHLDECEVIADFYQSNKDDLDISSIRHYDLHPHNLLFENSKLKAVLDLDNIGAIDRRIATSFNLYKLGRKCISKGSLSPETFKQMASVYFDLEALYPYARIELLQRFTLLFKAHYMNRKNEWDSDLKKYICGLREMKQMFL